MSPTSEPSPPPLDAVVITPELFRRPPRAASYARESEAVQRLAQVLADDSGVLLQRLADLAGECCDADSSGVSLLETLEDGTPVLRLAAGAGPMARHVGDTYPRDFSPWSLCLDRRSPQLFLRPARHYQYLAQTAPDEICEALVIELQHGGEQLGALWVASHRPDRHFDSEDVRMLSNMAGVAAAALRNGRRRAAAEASNETKDLLLLKVSHELRHPLQTILGWIEMLRSNAVRPDKMAAAYQAIYDSARVQSQLLSDLLDLYQITTGTLTVNPEPVDVCEVVEALIATIAPLSDAREIALKCDIARPVRFALTDALRLRQIVLNLVLNALKFTPGSGEITISVREERDTVQISVKDTGVGVAPEFLDSMFDPFRQAEQRIKGRERGMGIGLTIVRELVKASGGEIHAVSDGIGKGTTMVVHLPVAA